MRLLVAGVFVCLAGAAGAQPLDTPPALPAGQTHMCADSLYPPVALAEERQGSVGLSFTVTEKGDVINPVVVQSSGQTDLDLAGLGCVRNWHYLPALRDGKQVAVVWHVNIVWVADFDESEFGTAFANLRADAWKCLLASDVPKTLPKDFMGETVLNIMFHTTRRADVIIRKSSGNEALDDQLQECSRQSRWLGLSNKSSGSLTDRTFAIAWYPDLPR